MPFAYFVLLNSLSWKAHLLVNIDLPYSFDVLIVFVSEVEQLFIKTLVPFLPDPVSRPHRD